MIKAMAYGCNPRVRTRNPSAFLSTGELKLATAKTPNSYKFGIPKGQRQAALAAGYYRSGL